jgi:hypothetical protein
MAAEGPIHSHRQGVGSIVYACAAPALQIVVVPAGVKVLLGFHNPPSSWTNTVGPSLPGFT